MLAVDRVRRSLQVYLLVVRKFVCVECSLCPVAEPAGRQPPNLDCSPLPADRSRSGLVDGATATQLPCGCAPGGYRASRPPRPHTGAHVAPEVMHVRGRVASDQSEPHCSGQCSPPPFPVGRAHAASPVRQGARGPFLDRRRRVCTCRTATRGPRAAPSRPRQRPGVVRCWRRGRSAPATASRRRCAHAAPRATAPHAAMSSKVEPNAATSSA